MIVAILFVRHSLVDGIPISDQRFATVDVGDRFCSTGCCQNQSLRKHFCAVGRSRKRPFFLLETQQ